MGTHTMSGDYGGKWPTIVLLLAILSAQGYTVYLLHFGLVKSSTDIVTLVCLPLGIIPLLAYFSTSEILDCRRLNRPRKLCLKRFIGRVFLGLAFILPILLFLELAIEAGVFGGAHFSFNVTLLSGWSIVLGWSVLMALVMKKFAEAIKKLTEGLW